MAEVEVFKIDIQPVVSELAKLGSELEKARAKYQETKNSQTEYSEDAIRAKAEVNVLSKEVNALTNVLTNQQKGLGELKKATEANIDITKIQNNTIETNRKLYNALYNQQLRNPSPIVEKQLKSLSDTLKEQEKQLGDTRRNVGNYEEGFKSAFESIKGAVPALGGFQKAQQGVNMVMSANPIGGVILLLTSLKEIFGGNAVVADQLSFAFEALNKGFKFIIDTIVDTVTNFDKLGEAILNPIKFLKNLGSGAIQAGKDGFQSAKQLDVLTESIGAASVAIEKNNVLIENERTILLNKKKSDSERLAAAKSIIELEKQNSSTRIKIAEDELKAEQLKLKNTTKTAEQSQKLSLLAAKIERERADGVSAIRKAEIETDKILFGDREQLAKEAADKRVAAQEKQKADEQKYADNLTALSDAFLLTEREKLERSFEVKFESITGNSKKEVELRNAIEKQKIAALEKFEQDAEKKRQDNQKRIEAEIIANNAKEFNAQIEANKRSLDLELQQVDLSLGTEKEKAAKKRELNLDFLEEQLELTEQYLGADGVITQAEMQGIQKLRNEISLLRKDATAKKEGDPSFGKSLGLDEDGIKEAQNALSEISKAVEAVTGIVNMVYETRLNNIDNTKNAEIDAINQSTVSEEEKAIRIQKAERDAANAKYQIQLKQFQANKATSIIQTIINTAQAVIAQFANPVPFAGAILSALAAATGAAQIAVIASQPAPPKPSFATGVIGLEGAGTATSDSIDARLSRGESVITARATERFAPILAQMELAVGNRPNFQMGNKRFATGFIPTGDGGYSTRNAGSDLMARNATEKAMMQAVSAMPAQKLVLEEFRNFETNVDKSVAISEL
jgi:hypothetical protein